MKVLRLGDRGSEVSRLQQLLNHHGYTLKVDGIFGMATDKAVRDFQRQKGLTVDGIAGKQTWTALEATEDWKARALAAEAKLEKIRGILQ